MKQALVAYFITQAAVLFWFASPFKLSLYKFLTKKDTFQHEEVDLFLLSKSLYLKVLTCPFCFTFWCSIIVSAILSLSVMSFIFNASVCIVATYLYDSIIDFLKRVD
jgi:hypothetical protein